jgi:glutathione synthase/RimK-type ligase-like ATP-grasp enzyme
MPGTCAFLTMADLGDFVTDDELAVEPFARRGWRVEFVPWRGAEVDWSRFDAVVVRSTWDYHTYPDEFARTLMAIDRSGARLANALPTMCLNISKSYLWDLERRGVAIPPTLPWERGRPVSELPQVYRQLEADEIVIKPLIGAGAADTFRLTLPQALDRGAELERAYANRNGMVQPFLPAVIDEGEFSLILFNGELSHTILKTPKRHDFRVQEEYGSNIRKVTPEPALVAAANMVMNYFELPPLYARVDFVRHRGQFLLMELEVIEPSLYLRMDANAPERFAAAFAEWMDHGGMGVSR